LIAALVLLIASTFVNASPNCPSVNDDDCSGHGLCVAYENSADFTTSFYCSCESGFAGANCASAAASECAFELVSPTTTKNKPSSVIADVEEDSLVLTVRAQLVAGRKSTAITIAGRKDEYCSYPGKNWVRHLDGCSDVFTGTLKLSDLAKCGMTLTRNDADSKSYEANLVISQRDSINPFAGRVGSTPVERVTEHVVPIEVEIVHLVDAETADSDDTEPASEETS